MVTVSGLAGRERTFPLSGDPLQTFGTNLLLDQVRPLQVLKPDTGSYPLSSSKIELKATDGGVQPEATGHPLNITLTPSPRSTPRLFPATQPLTIDAGTIKETIGTGNITLDWLGSAPRVQAILEIDFTLDGVPVAGSLSSKTRTSRWMGKPGSSRRPTSWPG